MTNLVNPAIYANLLLSYKDIIDFTAAVLSNCQVYNLLYNISTVVTQQGMYSFFARITTAALNEVPVIIAGFTSATSDFVRGEYVAKLISLTFGFTI